MEFQNLSLQVDEGIALLTITREKQFNSLDRATLLELDAALAQLRPPAAGAGAVRALIVTGAGEKAFVAGADIPEMAAMSAEEARAFSALGHRAFSALEALPFPTLAAVNGFALGGGCELALACDLIYAAERAKFGQPEVGLGIIPGFGGTQRLARRLGPQRARELIFTGEHLDAPRARELGLVLEVLPREKLLDHCREVARKIAAKGPLAVAQAKRALVRGAEGSLEAGCEIEQQAFGVLFGTTDQKEGMKAFLEKRPPRFTGA